MLPLLLIIQLVLGIIYIFLGSKIRQVEAGSYQLIRAGRLSQSATMMQIVQVLYILRRVALVSFLGVPAWSIYTALSRFQ